MATQLKTLPATRRVITLVLKAGARLVTWCRLEPSNPLLKRLAQRIHSSTPAQYSVFLPAAASYLSAGPGTSSTHDKPHHSMSSDDVAALLVAGAAVAAKNPERAVAVLKSHIDRQDDDPEARLFERLAAAQLATGYDAQGEETLRRGLAIHPGDDPLRVALADALVRRGKWAAAIDHWERVPESRRDTASVWVLIAMTRAYRRVNRHRDAADLAEKATVLWPENGQLELELAKCRPFIVDWQNCLRSVGFTTGTQPDSAGEIAHMGFLHGGRLPLRGRLFRGDAQACEVRFLVNDLHVASTVASAASRDPGELAFSFNCAELLEYLGDGDIIRIESGGIPVTFRGLGDSAGIQCGLPSRFDLLRRQIADGYVLTKNGRLRPGHSAESKRLILDFYSEIATLITERTTQPVYPFYGNLLGAVRENDIIRHDVDGFDMLYLCSTCHPADVKTEVEFVCRLLLERGYHLKFSTTSVMIRRNRGDTEFLDLNYGWFNADDEFNVSYGWRYSPVRGRGRFVAPRTCRLADRSVAIPGNAEEVLVQLYGRQWHCLDQGYSTTNEIVRPDAFLLTKSDLLSLQSSAPSAAN